MMRTTAPHELATAMMAVKTVRLESDTQERVLVPASHGIDWSPSDIMSFESDKQTKLWPFVVYLPSRACNRKRAGPREKVGEGGGGGEYG